MASRVHHLSAGHPQNCFGEVRVQERGDANRIDLNPKCCMFLGWNLNIILYCVVFQQPKRSTFWGWCQDRYNSPRTMYLWHFVSTDTSCCYAPRKFHDGTGLLSTPPRRLLSCQAKILFSRIDWRPTTCLWSSSINSFNEEKNIIQKKIHIAFQNISTVFVGWCFMFVTLPLIIWPRCCWTCTFHSSIPMPSIKAMNLMDGTPGIIYSSLVWQDKQFCSK